MDDWGNLLKGSVQVVAEMAAIGLGLSKEDFTLRGTPAGPHLLAPTGSDLNEFGQVGTVLAGKKCRVRPTRQQPFRRKRGLIGWK